MKIQPPFLITGLPRSRTAWLANLFTTEHTLCFHGRMSASDYAPKAIEALIAENPSFRIGLSDPLLTVMHEELMRRWPSAPWLYVSRPLEHAVSSFRSWLQKNELPGAGADLGRLFDFHEVAAARLKASDGVLVIDFDDLDDPDKVGAAWDHLLPGLLFNERRWEILNRLRVEQCPIKAKEELCCQT